MGELRATMPLPEAAGDPGRGWTRDARAAKAAGDERPIGLLRGVALHGLVTGAGQERPAVSRAPGGGGRLDTLESAAAGAPGAGREPVLVDGEPVTAALARELLERLDALCPGGLQAPDRRHADDLGHRRRRAAARRGDPPGAGVRGPARAGAGPAAGGRPVRAHARRSGGSPAPGTAPAGIPAAATGPAGPIWTTWSRTPTAGETDCANCAACAAGTTG